MRERERVVPRVGVEMDEYTTCKHSNPLGIARIRGGGAKVWMTCSVFISSVEKLPAKFRACSNTFEQIGSLALKKSA